MADERKDRAKGQDVDGREKSKEASTDSPGGGNAPGESGSQVHAPPSRGDARTSHNPAKNPGSEQLEKAGRGVRAKPTEAQRDPRNMAEQPHRQAPNQRRSGPAAREDNDSDDTTTGGSDASTPIDDRAERRKLGGEEDDEEEPL